LKDDEYIAQRGKSTCGKRVFMKDLPRRLANVPLSTILLVCLCLLGLGIVRLVQNYLPPFRDETALRVVHIFLADLNGDNHQDVYMVTNQMHRILFNDGNGNFTGNRELSMHNYVLALGDLDGDDSLDALLTRFENGMMGGELLFECAEAPPDLVIPAHSDSVPGQVFAIQDRNRDSLPEGYIAGCCGGGTAMMNYATLFSNYRACLGTEPPADAALGDLNGDGTLDVFLAKRWTTTHRDNPNEVWFNDGRGNFTDSGQRLGKTESYEVALGDLNRDGFLDAVVGHRNGGDVWFNDGQGNFSDGEQRLGRGMTNTIFVVDPDKDGDLDVFLGGGTPTSIRLWLNDGTGRFMAGERVNYDRYAAVTMGDVTGDGILDIFVGGPDSYQIWHGDEDGHFSAYDPSPYR
jgi:hypothetical protein